MLSSDSHSDVMVIAIDAMGGDHAPLAVIEGAELALKSLPKTKIFFQLYGIEEKIAPLVAKSPLLQKHSEIIPCETVVSAEEKPSMAIRTGRHSSMQYAINAVKNKEAAAVVSAGNTGALMAMSKITLRTLPQISRPAIIAVMPTVKGDIVMLDLGANVECDAANLHEFAVMGEAFARIILGVEKPRIGLLNIGSEESKGKDSIKLAHSLLSEANLPTMDFVGYIEANDIAEGVVDVVVTDGFSGNIALKAIEGTAKLFKHVLKKAFSSSWLAKIGYLLIASSLNKIYKAIDPRNYNGAMFIGLNGIVVKSHGGMDAKGIANAIKAAFELANAKINEQIASELASNIREEI